MKSDHFFFEVDGAEEMVIVLFFTVILTAPLIPLSSRINLGNKIPLEFPIRLILVIAVLMLICYNTKLFRLSWHLRKSFCGFY